MNQAKHQEHFIQKQRDFAYWDYVGKICENILKY